MISSLNCDIFFIFHFSYSVMQIVTVNNLISVTSYLTYLKFNSFDLLICEGNKVSNPRI